MAPCYNLQRCRYSKGSYEQNFMRFYECRLCIRYMEVVNKRALISLCGVPLFVNGASFHAYAVQHGVYKSGINVSWNIRKPLRRNLRDVLYFVSLYPNRYSIPVLGESPRKVLMPLLEVTKSSSRTHQN
jgi:hypothetical protein